MNQHIESFWYVIKVIPQWERLVEKKLKRIGLVALVPVQKQTRQWSDRQKKVDVVLFIGYVFVCISADRKNEVFDVGREVLGYLQTDGKPAIVKEKEMEAIKKLTHLELPVVVARIKPVPGDQVEIKEGPLRGLFGTVLEMSGKQRLVIQLPSLCSMAQIEVDAGNVKLI